MTNKQMKVRNTRACVAAFALVSLPLALAASAMAAGAQTQTWAPTASQAITLKPAEKITGIAPTSQAIHVTVALKLRNAGQLQSFVSARRQLAVSGTTLAAPMSTQQFAADHAPMPDRANAVVAYLKANGFTNVKLAANRLTVSADGNVDAAQRAFQTTFVTVNKDGRQAIANDKAAQVPATLQDVVLSVVGLQTVHKAHPMLQVAKRQPGAHTQATTGHNPVDFSSIYGASGLPTAGGVTVGIIAEGDLSATLSDLQSFTSQNGLSDVATDVVGDGSSDTDGTDEWNLDSQDIVGMAGGEVGKLVFYDAPSLTNSDLTDVINAAVSANEAQVINVSLGECETFTSEDGSMAADDQLFETAEAQGQTFSVSSGDSGADECGDGGITPSYPASSPNVVAVGGTTLTTSGKTWSKETAWDGSGGSPSLVEPKPDWQTAASGSKRVVPDVAFDADPNSGALVIVNGEEEQIGGTSLAAPLFTGSWARLLAGDGSLGFAGSHIYTLAAGDFHDVTSGNNGGETAKAGYDDVTGRGSFNLAKVAGDVSN